METPLEWMYQERWIPPSQICSVSIKDKDDDRQIQTCGDHCDDRKLHAVLNLGVLRFGTLVNIDLTSIHYIEEYSVNEFPYCNNELGYAADQNIYTSVTEVIKHNVKLAGNIGDNLLLKLIIGVAQDVVKLSD